MTKADLIEKIAKDANLPKSAATSAVGCMIDCIVGAMSKGDTVTLVGFGTFSVSSRAARMGRNPKTGAPIQIAAAKVPRFKPGRTLKDAVNHR